MIELTAAQIAAAVEGRVVGDPEARVSGPVVIDSRAVVPGALFVALPGERVDGNDFAPAAALAGAGVVLVSREVNAPSQVLVPDVQTALGALARFVLAQVRAERELTVVAITGSVGKTTTKDLVGQLLSPDGPTVVPSGSFNNEIGLPLTVLRVDATTRYLVLEMGADEEGNLTYLTHLAPPDVAVVLVVGTAHLGRFGSVEAIARAKSELVAGLVPSGVAVLNADDSRVAAMRDLAPAAVLTFGTVTGAQVRADDVRVDASGHASFQLGAPGEQSAAVHLQLVGAHHVVNALAAAAVGLSLGLTAATVAERLSAATAVSPHRMQVTERPDGVTVIDDSYNANPDSMRAALRALATVAGRTRRSIAVLGEMLELGEASRERHDEIGRLAVRLNIDLLVVVGAGAWAIFDGAQMEGSWGEEVVQVADPQAAEELLHDTLRTGDVVLVKGSNGTGLWRLGDRLAAAGTEDRP